MSGVNLIINLNAIAAAHGVGRIDMVEDRVVGIKSREVYEAPAATVLHQARIALEQLTLDRETLRLKTSLGQEMARLAYDGMWFSPLRASISAFVDQACQTVTGTVKVRLCRGNCTVIGRTALKSLYQVGMATYSDGDEFNHESAEGFVKIFGLGTRIANSHARVAEDQESPTKNTTEALA